MAMNTETDAHWVELSNMGYNLRDKDGDVAVALYFKEAFINDFEQTSVMMEEVIKEAESHHREILGDNEIKHCRNCFYWQQAIQWKGNCTKHPWPKNKYNEDATANGCEDYRDKNAGFQPISAIIKDVLKGGINAEK